MRLAIIGQAGSLDFRQEDRAEESCKVAGCPAESGIARKRQEKNIFTTKTRSTQRIQTPWCLGAFVVRHFNCISLQLFARASRPDFLPDHLSTDGRAGFSGSLAASIYVSILRGDLMENI